MKTRVIRVAKPSAPALNLKEFYSESYAVPPYQREFSWTESQVDDLYGDFANFCGADEPYYFLGQTIVSDNDSGPERYSIVDGQQRATALLVLLAALRNHARQFCASNRNLKNLVERELVPMLQFAEEDGLIPRVRAADDGNPMMISLIEDSDRPGIRDDYSNTCENLLSAYEQLLERLASDLTTPHDIELYFRRISEGVILVRLEIHEEEAAIGVYERINDRGLELDNADLIKNTAFARLDRNHYEDASSQWAEASKTLRECTLARPKRMQFLLRAMIFARTGELVGSSHLRKAWQKQLKSKQHAVDLFKELPKRAEQMRRINHLEFPGQKRNKDLGAAARHFKFVQHYPVLLAGAHLNLHAYHRLIELTEVRVIVSVLAAERPQEFERFVPTWAHAIAKLDSSASAKDVDSASKSAFKDFQILLASALTNVGKLDYRTSKGRRRLRFVLAYLSHHVQVEAEQAKPPPLRELLRKQRKGAPGKKPVGFDVEHVRPTSKYEDKAATHKIGNLVLANAKRQRGAGNIEPKDKEAIYQSSELVLTRSLAPLRSNEGKHAKRVIGYIQTDAPVALTRWTRDDKAIDARGKAYISLLKQLLEAGTP